MPKKKITQQELSSKIGVSRQTMNAIELNKTMPSTKHSIKIANFFKVTVNEIFKLNDTD